MTPPVVHHQHARYSHPPSLQRTMFAVSNSVLYGVGSGTVLDDESPVQRQRGQWAIRVFERREERAGGDRGFKL